jgi:stage II sporulation protein D
MIVIVTRVFLITLVMSSLESKVEARDVSIGLFSLFRPRVVEIRTRKALLVLVQERKTESRRVLVEGQIVRICANAEMLNVDWLERDGQLIHRRSAVGLIAFGETYSVGIPQKIQRDFEGRLEVASANDELRLRLVLVQETAIQQILGAEMAGCQAVEALKTQGILIRSYLNTSKGRHKHQDFDFCDTTHCQFFAEFRDEPRRFREAVASTNGMVLTFHGEPVQPLYTAACGGLTLSGSASDAAYNHPSVRCTYCSAHPLFAWETTLGKLKLLRALPVSKSSGVHEALAALALPEAEEGSRRLKQAVRNRVGRAYGWDIIPSDRYSIDATQDPVHIKGHGSGHNRGLCQAGAIELARQGKSYREIIEFYFPGTELTR